MGEKGEQKSHNTKRSNAHQGTARRAHGNALKMYRHMATLILIYCENTFIIAVEHGEKESEVNDHCGIRAVEALFLSAEPAFEANTLRLKLSVTACGYILRM